MRTREMIALALVLGGCAGAPVAAPPAEAVEAEKPPTPEEAEEASKPAQADAGPPDTGPIYTEPRPQIVRRHHVFGSMRARAAKKVVMTSVLTTAADEAETLIPGTEAVLEFKPKGSKEWVPVADVIEKKVTMKGRRVLGNERQEISLEIQTVHKQKAKLRKQSPFRRNARVRLQVDRMEGGAAAPAAEPAEVSGKGKFGLVVSFLSHGAGTDRAAKDKVDLAIEQAQRAGKMKLPYRVVHWGKEGESDYCFPLRGKSHATRAFVKKVAAIAAKSSRVTMRRDALCRQGH